VYLLKRYIGKPPLFLAVVAGKMATAKKSLNIRTTASNDTYNIYIASLVVSLKAVARRNQPTIKLSFLPLDFRNTDGILIYL